MSCRGELETPAHFRSHRSMADDNNPVTILKNMFFFLLTLTPPVALSFHSFVLVEQVLSPASPLVTRNQTEGR